MRTRSTIAAMLVGAALALASAVPAAALPSGSPAGGGDGTRRVALGDSWAAGTAAGEIEAASGTCRRSTWAYPAVVARAAGETLWTSRACASATGSGNGQFAALTPTTEVVTATVGADATGLGALASACSTAGTPARCDAETTRFAAALATLPRALDTALADIRRRAPRAAVSVTGYPLLAEGRACPTGPADAPRAARLDDAVTRLDAVLAQRAGAAGVRFVDVRDAFRGHGVCAPEPWLTPLTGADTLLAGSPTATGHALGMVAALAAPVPAPPAPTTPPADGRAGDAPTSPLFAG